MLAGTQAPSSLPLGEGQLESGGPYGGPPLPVRGDAHHGSGHGLDLSAGRLQPAPTPAFPRGPLLLQRARPALHLAWESISAGEAGTRP